MAHHRGCGHLHMHCDVPQVLSAKTLGCRADMPAPPVADPDANPTRAPRLRPSAPAVMALGVSSDGGGDYYDDYGGQVAFAFGTVEDPIQLLRCTGGNVIGFSLDASDSIIPVEFFEMQSEV